MNMKIIRTIRDFQWREAWLATQALLMCCGGIALFAWFANPLRPLALGASLLFVALLWCLLFRLVLAFRIRRHHARKRVAPAANPNWGWENQVECDVQLALMNQGYTKQQIHEAIEAAPADVRLDFRSLFRAALGQMAN
jgi:hypothetical protein